MGTQWPVVLCCRNRRHGDSSLGGLNHPDVIVEVTSGLADSLERLYKRGEN